MPAPRRLQRTSTTTRLRISAAGATDIGHVKLLNEDAILVDQPLRIFAVLDGMGGHPAGDVASRLASEVIADRVLHAPSRGRWPRQVLEAALRTASDEVYIAGLGRRDRFGMGTTAVACLIASRHAAIGHVGDSRAYLLRGGTLTQLTRDHAVVQELIDAGKLTPRAAKRHPARHTITRHLGEQGRVDPELTELEIEAGDRLLLCSDGLHGYVAAPAIRRVLAGQGAVAKVAGRLVELALESRTPDNVSALVVEGCR